MTEAATTLTVNGAGGALYLIAAILFLIAAIIAWFVMPRAYWPSLVALGLCLAAFAHLFT
jgi:hypothetical protein